MIIAILETFKENIYLPSLSTIYFTPGVYLAPRFLIRFGDAAAKLIRIIAILLQ